MRFFALILACAYAVSAIPHPEGGQPDLGTCSIDAHNAIQTLALVEQVGKTGVFKTDVSVSSISTFYENARSLALGTTDKAKTWMAYIGGGLALPTICGFVWTTASGLMSGSIVGTAVSAAWYLATSIFYPLFFSSLLVLSSYMLLSYGEKYGIKAFDSLEDYTGYTAYLKERMAALYRVADGLEPEKAIPKINDELQKNMAPELIKASWIWCKHNESKFPKEAKALRQVLVKLDKDPQDKEEFKKGVAKLVEDAKEQELKVLHEKH